MRLQIGEIFSTYTCEILLLSSKINCLVKLFMILQTYFRGMEEKHCQSFSCAAEN